jgi:hypothetical protein
MVKETFGAPEYCNEHFHQIKNIWNDRRQELNSYLDTREPSYNQRRIQDRNSP